MESRRRPAQRRCDKRDAGTLEDHHSCGHTWAWSSLSSKGQHGWHANGTRPIVQIVAAQCKSLDQAMERHQYRLDRHDEKGSGAEALVGRAQAGRVRAPNSPRWEDNSRFVLYSRLVKCIRMVAAVAVDARLCPVWLQVIAELRDDVSATRRRSTFWQCCSGPYGIMCKSEPRTRPIIKSLSR